MTTENKPSAGLNNILFNVIIPVIILTKFSTENYLGPKIGLLVAISFPALYGLRDLLKNKKWNFISILGIISVLLTGGLALFKLNTIWFAVKEASIPLILSLVVIISTKTKYSFLETLILNPKLFDMDLINQSIDKNNSRNYSNKLLTRATWLIAFSFLLSAFLNFILAIIILKSTPGTTEFNTELGKMTALSFPVISIPVIMTLLFTMWYLINGLKKATGLSMDEMMKVKK